MPSFDGDQAAGLRRLLDREQLRVITFAAGSPGVGKSVLIANLAVLIARLGKRVLILDENSRRNMASCFGFHTRGDLQNVVDSEKSLSEILLSVAANIRVLPIARSMKKLRKFTHEQQSAFLSCISRLEAFADIVLIDASPDHDLGFSPVGLAAHETVVVISKTGASITDAYSLIKKVSLGYSLRNFRILVNKVSGLEEAATIYRNLEHVTRARAIAELNFSGYVPLDAHFQQAARFGQTIAEMFPEATATHNCREIAEEMLNWPVYANGCDRLEKFGQQLLHLSQYVEPLAIYA
ncbi:MAG: AAA family ATPase [Candidatus Accumulibacter sp.]|jgi:flagellar biosynthesis protein FlhG|nr:AAA family ATPase [Accumulibacter sp.]